MHGALPACKGWADLDANQHHALYLHLGSDKKQRQLAWRKLIKEILGIEVLTPKSGTAPTLH